MVDTRVPHGHLLKCNKIYFLDFKGFSPMRYVLSLAPIGLLWLFCFFALRALTDIYVYKF